MEASEGAGERRTEAVPAVSPAEEALGARGLSPERGAMLRAEQAREKEQHPWRKAWSVKQQRAQHKQRTEEARIARAV